MELALSEHNKIREKHLNTISLKLTEDLTTGAKKYAEELSLVSVSFSILLLCIAWNFDIITFIIQASIHSYDS